MLINTGFYCKNNDCFDFEFEASATVSLSLAAQISIQDAEMYIKNTDRCPAISRTLRIDLPQREKMTLTPGKFISQYSRGTFLVFSQQRKVFAFMDGKLLNDEAPDCWDRVAQAWQIFI